jgi:hypothetical protein
MAATHHPDDLAYYAALGHVVESAGTLEHLIYLTAEFVFDLSSDAREHKTSARNVLKEIRRAALQRGLLNDPRVLSDVDRWIGSCGRVLIERGTVVHVVSVVAGRDHERGVRQTNDLAAPLRTRDARQMEQLHGELTAHSGWTARMFGVFSALRGAAEPDWRMRVRVIETTSD